MAAHHLVVDQGDDVLVEDMLLLVGEILEIGRASCRERV